jgi:hypothetical protein
MLNAELIGTIAAGGGGNAPIPGLPFFGQYYGGVYRGNVGDTHLDRSDESGVFAFFFAEYTGTVTALDWYYRYDYNAGTYSDGNGGVYTLEIRAANPASKMPLIGVVPICKLDGWTPQDTSGAGQRFVGSLAFTTTGQLVAGQPYALIARNTHANPAGNYISQNTPWQGAFDDDSDPADYEEPGDAVAGAIFPEDVGSSIKVIRGWHPAVINPGAGNQFNLFPIPTIWRGNFRYRRIGCSPFLGGLIYADGQRGNWTCGGGEDTYNIAISGNSQVRERFRVSRATRTVSGVFVRVTKVNTSGSCVVSLESGPSSETSGTGTVIEQVTVSQSFFHNDGGIGWTGPDQIMAHWVWVPFSQPRALTLGQIYSIRLSAAGSFGGRIFLQNRWEAHGLSPEEANFDDYEDNRCVSMNAWEDSMGAQSSSNGGSSWVYEGRKMAPILFKCV